MTAHDENYYHQTYGLTRPHSEVLNACRLIVPGAALDLGCGSGRNALWLAQQGFQVTAWDKNPASLARLRDIIAAEGITRITVAEKDLNHLHIDGEYDFILSTVVMMFLDASTIPNLIAAMQRATRPGGYNLIVAAMDTEDYPIRADFAFAFRVGELQHYYAQWQTVKYNEDVGQLHRTNAAGNRTKQRFATALMRKV